MTTPNPQTGSNQRTYRKPSVLDRGIVEHVTKDIMGEGRPEHFGITFCWGDLQVAEAEPETESTEAK